MNTCIVAMYVVLSSSYETFGITVLEACACGKPMVAFDIAPHPEVVKDEEAGDLAAAGGVRAMAGTIASFYKNKFTQKGNLP